MTLDPKHPVRVQAALDLTVTNMVHVNERAINALTRPENLQPMSNVLPADSPLAKLPRAYIPYFVAMNTMNYQFWDVNERGEFVRYSHNGLVGALAMQQSFYDAWMEGVGTSLLQGPGEDIAVVAAHRMRELLKRVGLPSIFGNMPDPGTTETPSRMTLLDEVLDPARLQMVSSYLADRVSVDQALGWADAQMLATVFPKAYGDDYLKKAQLTLMFIASAWGAQQGDSGRRIELNVTAAADYQLPKVLRSLGLLTYDLDLAKAVDSGVMLEADSMEEVSIRAATVYACDKLAEHFDCTIEEVDFWLWSNRNTARDARFHLTRTTSY